MLSQKSLKVISNSNEIIFISDFHFGSDNHIKEKRKFKFFSNILKHVRENNTILVLVGDVFDFLFDFNGMFDTEIFPHFFELLKVSQVNENIFYVLGNHDFWGEKLIHNLLNIRTFNELILEINNKKFYISHGETVDKNSFGDRILRNILRNKFNIKLFKFFHPILSVFLAKTVSKISRGNSKNLKYSFQNHINFAKTLWEDNIDIVILGHLHKPFIYKNGVKYLGIVGDFIKHNSILIWKNGKLYHKTFSDQDLTTDKH